MATATGARRPRSKAPSSGRGGTKSTAPSKSRSKRPSKAKGEPTPKPKGLRARRDAKRAARLAKLQAKSGNRYRVHYDVDGPRVRLGILWFVLAVAALVAGPIVAALYFGVIFAAAAAQALRVWRADGDEHAEPVVAFAVAGVVVLSASIAPPAMGLVVILAAAAAVAAAARRLDAGETMAAAVARAGLTLQAALPTAVAGGSVVLLADRDFWAAAALLALVAGYESGDYLIGSGSANAIEGPVAGTAAVVVTTLVVAAFGIGTFDGAESVAFGLAVAPLAFAGQILASVMMPHSRCHAPALRRIDSLLLSAPLWYFGIALFG